MNRRPLHNLILAAALVTMLAVRTAADVPLKAVKDSGVAAGLIVHVGNGDGSGTVALAKSGKFIVHRLVPDRTKLDGVRNTIRAAGLYG